MVMLYVIESPGFLSLALKVTLVSLKVGVPASQPSHTFSTVTLVIPTSQSPVISLTPFALIIVV